MVDVSGKEETARVARAEGWLRTSAEALQQFQEGTLTKGDAGAVARVAGIMGAKRTSELIPLCHPLALTGVEVSVTTHAPDRLQVVSVVKCCQRTGVEMEALTAVSIACLALYDMLKSLDKGIEIGPIRLLEKTGGKSDYKVAESHGL